MLARTHWIAATLISFMVANNAAAESIQVAAAPTEAVRTSPKPSNIPLPTPTEQAKSKPELMVLVFERPNCGYCRLVRENIIPAYWRAPESQRLPMRVINIDAIGTAGHALKEPIDTTPTFVFMRNDTEVHRITGYPGRNNFFAVVDWILKQPANSKLGTPPKFATQLQK